jgi:hypothetical protein
MGEQIRQYFPYASKISNSVDDQSTGCLVTFTAVLPNSVKKYSTKKKSKTKVPPGFEPGAQDSKS